MRTTLKIDDDILKAAKSLAKQKRKSVGKILSELARDALKPQHSTRVRNGVPLFEINEGSSPVTMEIVNELRDEGY